jgi:hypothetical protein
MAVDPGDPDTGAVRMLRVYQSVPGSGRDHGRDSQYCGASGSQPFVSSPAGTINPRLPGGSEICHANRFDGNGIRCLNLEIAKSQGNVFRVNFSMNQSFQQCRRRALRAINDGLPARMPAPGRAQPAKAVEGRVVADSPQGHASRPWSIC